MMEYIIALPPLARVLLLMASAVALADVAFYLFLMIASGNGRHRKRAAGGGEASVAVVLRSGFNRDGLAEDVERFLSQDYAPYSVVVVDESGEGDGTPMLDSLRSRYSNLYVTATSNDAKFTSIDKLSLTVGIKSTEAEWIVQASRHCPPKSVHWLTELSTHFQEGVSVVMGYNRVVVGAGDASRYAAARHRWRALVRLAHARSVGPYLGDGQNLAYRRDAFLSTRGFAGYGYLLGGEGELLTHRLAQTGKVHAEEGIKAQTQGKVALTWREYFRGRLGEMQAMLVLPRSVRFSMQRNARLRLLTWLFGVALLLSGSWLLWAGVGLLGLRRLLFLLCGVVGMVRYSDKWNLLWMWLQDVMEPCVWVAESRRYRAFKHQPRWRR